MKIASHMSVMQIAVNISNATSSTVSRMSASFDLPAREHCARLPNVRRSRFVADGRHVHFNSAGTTSGFERDLFGGFAVDQIDHDGPLSPRQRTAIKLSLNRVWVADDSADHIERGKIRIADHFDLPFFDLTGGG